MKRRRSQPKKKKESAFEINILNLQICKFIIICGYTGHPASQQPPNDDDEEQADDSPVTIVFNPQNPTFDIHHFLSFSFSRIQFGSLLFSVNYGPSEEVEK